jgi:uncharacterized protein (TIGR03067 family)
MTAQNPSLVVACLIVANSIGPLHAGSDPNAMAARVTRLIERLGDDNFHQREAATGELVQLGEPALGLLRRAAMSTHDPEIRWRTEWIVEMVTTSIAFERLQGTWSLVAYETDGKQIQGEDPNYVFTFRGDQWSIHAGGQLFQAGRIGRIEVHERRNAIDLLITGGSYAGATAFSIFAITGDSLQYLNCGEPRATEFKSMPGDGRHYLKFRRVSGAQRDDEAAPETTPNRSTVLPRRVRDVIVP